MERDQGFPGSPNLFVGAAAEEREGIRPPDILLRGAPAGAASGRLIVEIIAGSKAIGGRDLAENLQEEGLLAGE